MVGVDDDRPAKKAPVHQIGEDISSLSISELAERIEILRTETARLEAAIGDRRRTKDAAHSFFKT
ncbi:MAG: DUF1192 domain-containing protein [Bauldia sp.]